jgi:hypothetical protein
MKSYHFSISRVFWAAAWAIVIAGGCEYPVEQSQWYLPEAQADTVRITGIDPAQATAGYNYITIYGENFDGAIDTSVVHDVSRNRDTTIIYNGIYFNGLQPEVLDISATSIRVRRPNLATDSCTVKIASAKALGEAKLGPYKIDAVVSTYGSFLDKLPLGTVTTDTLENLYVVCTVTSTQIYKITPAGVKTTHGNALRAPTDIKIGPDGRLYMVGNGPSSGSTGIQVVNLDSSRITTWFNCPPHKDVRFCDFDSHGYFYAGGSSTDILIIASDSTFKYAGVYGSSEILGLHVYGGYLYVAANMGTARGIWRHLLSDTGSLGPQELVLDWSTTGQFASRTIRNFGLAENGTLFVETDDASNALVIVTSQGADFFYKGIAPAACGGLVYGPSHYVYAINGTGASGGLPDIVSRIDMGATCAHRW